MKKLASIITLVLSLGLFASCELLELDNFDGPNAQVTGRFLDAKTGEKMGIESSVSSVWDWGTWSMKTTTVGSMVVIEQGWKGNDGQQVSEDQNWMVRFDGQYTNNLVFAADYKLDTKNLPCYEPENVDFTLKKGSNTVDFTVTGGTMPKSSARKNTTSTRTKSSLTSPWTMFATACLWLPTSCTALPSRKTPICLSTILV